jgi:di/tricarboxylate transporter
LEKGSIHAGALAVVLGMASTYAFAMPPAMTTVVLGISTGWTTTSQMARYGFFVVIPCMIFITFVAYPIAILLL